MEQSYKEKYEQAIERLKQWDREHPCAGFVLSDRDKFIFPELAESENEKVRKALIDFFGKGAKYGSQTNGVYDKDILAWLEKQGQVKESTISQHENKMCKENDDSLTSEDEKVRKALIKLVKIENFNGYVTFDGIDTEDVLGWIERQGEHANFRNKIQVGDKVTRNENGVLVNLSQLNRVAKKNEKQDEHAIYNVPAREVILAIWDLGNEWKELTNGCISTKYGTQLDYIQKHWEESEYYLREKQGEHKASYTTIVETGDGGINAHVTKELPTDGCDDEQKPFDYENANIQQKDFAPKDEPKFKVGDFIANGYCFGKVIALTDDAYLLDTEQGIPFSCEHNTHLWTIQDAKDGDVLATSAGAFIYNGNNGGGSCPGCYCGINTLGRFQSGVEHHWTGKKVYPATKEQLDLLFEKMKEAGYLWNGLTKRLINIKESGYEWDSKNKKYKNIEQKSANKIEPVFNVGDKIQYLKGCGTIMTIEKIENGEYIFANNMGHTTIENGNKCYLVEQKPAEWHREDEQNLNACLGYIQDEYLRRWLEDVIFSKYENKSTWSEDDELLNSVIEEVRYIGDFPDYPTKEENELYDECLAKVDWLKSLKVRVQPKQEWSEEDKYMYDILCGTIENTDINENTKYKLISWLKSLRPQNTYNPYKAVVDSIATMVEKYAPFDSNLQDFYDNVKVKCKDAKEYDDKYPQNKWKPSAEQMEALDWQVENTSVESWAYKATKELLEDLKKLKEE